jgi:hypothetical protein
MHPNQAQTPPVDCLDPSDLIIEILNNCHDSVTTTELAAELDLPALYVGVFLARVAHAGQAVELDCGEWTSSAGLALRSTAQQEGFQCPADDDLVHISVGDRTICVPRVPRR